jgi:hypothetical protein
MTARLTVVEGSLPVVLKAQPDEILSSWLHCHTIFYGLTEPMFISWLNFDIRKMRSLDGRVGLG